MREYGLVFSRFWINLAIQSLSVDGKLLALYLLTCSHTNMLGCFRLPIGYIAEDLQWSSERVKKGFKELIHIRFLSLDEATGWLIIHQFLRWNPIENPNQGKSIVKLFHHIPSNSTVYKHIITILLEHGKHLEEAFLSHLQTLSQALLNQDQEQDTNQDQEQKQDVSKVQTATVTVSKTVNQTVTPTVEHEVVITIPLNDHSEFPITQMQVEEWQSLYPAINVIQTLRHIRGWNLANVKKRKTKNGVLKHITSWLAKEQDRCQSSPQTALSSHNTNLYDYNQAVSEQWLKDTTNVIEHSVGGRK